jgi:serine/threonine-protein kinase
VPKTPGGERELLFVDIAGMRNVVPVIDSGETDDCWVLVMPRATKSLREHIQQVGHPFEPSDATKVLTDIATALVDIDAHSVVHRDLKPENVLLLDGRWCLADFGISRYAEATTAPDTKKFALSPPYAAPERWRAERATAATDIYSCGVIAYELLAGSLPFAGPSIEDFREQHLHQTAPSLAGVQVALDAIVMHCLYKPSAARPRPGRLLSRIEGLDQSRASGPGLARLQAAHHADALQQGDASRRNSERQSETERRSGLLAHAKDELAQVGTALRDAIAHAAPTIEIKNIVGGGWNLRLGKAQLELSSSSAVGHAPWGSGWGPPKFDVIAASALGIRIPTDRYGYEGRGHSLWYCDAQEKGTYSWFETAFMILPLIPKHSPLDPFPLKPGDESARAIGPGIAEFQLAWPFTPIALSDLDEFIDRWASWLADASQGKLLHPTTMPEHQPDGSWRRT